MVGRKKPSLTDKTTTPSKEDGTSTGGSGGTSTDPTDLKEDDKLGEDTRKEEKKVEKKVEKKDDKGHADSPKEGVTQKSDASKLDPTKDEKLRKAIRKLIDDLFLVKYTKEYYPFKLRDIVRLLYIVKDLFKLEPVMVECRLPIVVVGDIHGQFADLQRMFTIFSDNERHGCYNQRFVFLGDYVDRGKQSLECIMLVFVLKILYPSEMRPINMAYGFLQELEERYEKVRKESYRNLNKDGRILFQYFNQVFAHMPLCCIAGDNILCMHGGICPEMTSRAVFKEIPKPLLNSTDHKVAESLLWADPMYGEPRARFNEIRGLAVHFGEPLVDEVCENLGVKLIVRGHQMMMNGFKFFNGHKLVTIFTASHYYPDKLNHGAVMVVDATGRCGFRVIVPSKTTEVKVFRGEHEVANEHDDGYKTNPDLLMAKVIAARVRAEKEGTVRRKKTPIQIQSKSANGPMRNRRSRKEG